MNCEISIWCATIRSEEQWIIRHSGGDVGGFSASLLGSPHKNSAQGYAGHVLVREKILRVSSIAELTENSAKPARTAEA